MITGYSDHAANERTFLAWVRTGIAMVAFGFVIEKFNLFLRAIAAEALNERAGQLVKFSGRGGRYDGLALIFGGIGLVVLSTVRFVRTTRLCAGRSARPARPASPLKSMRAKMRTPRSLRRPSRRATVSATE